MLKRFVLGIALCSASIGYVAGSDMKTYETIDREEVPVISSIKEFKDSKYLNIDSAIFNDMEINQEFIETFDDVFGTECNILKFCNCHLADGFFFSDVIPYGFVVRKLSIDGSSEVATEDIQAIRNRISPYQFRELSVEKNAIN